MSFENRGGFPIVRRLSVTTTFGKYQLPVTTKYLQITNGGAVAVRVYFTQDDYTAGVNYIELASSTGSFEGPVELRANAAELYLAGVAGTANPVVIVAYQRRG
jgi:hypothetical protein